MKSPPDIPKVKGDGSITGEAFGGKYGKKFGRTRWVDDGTLPGGVGVGSERNRGSKAVSDQDLFEDLLGSDLRDDRDSLDGKHAVDVFVQIL